MKHLWSDSVQKSPYHRTVPLVRGGILLDTRWFSPLEGPLTVLAKIAITNVMNASDLCRLMFAQKLVLNDAEGIHGRSLLDISWCRSKSGAHPFICDGFSGRLLTNFSKHWARSIASDMHIRYCPTCLNYGFQSSICQIDGLNICPVHREPLLEHCPSCMAPTERYAITIKTFANPMACSHCGTFYAPAWRNDVPPQIWRDDMDLKSYAIATEWLREIDQLTIDWPDLGHWITPRVKQENSRAKRIGIFNLLTTIQPLADFGVQNIIGTEGKLIAFKPANFFQNKPTPSPARIKIYKAIRRHYWRVLNVHHWRSKLNWLKLIWLAGNATLISIDSSIPSGIHGFMLWRCRFEEKFGQATLSNMRDIDVAIRPRMLAWPVNCEVDDGLWGQFVVRCLIEDLDAARLWADQVFPAGGADRLRMDDIDQSALTKWASYLSPDIEPWPLGLTQLMIGSKSQSMRYFTLAWNRRMPQPRPLDSNA